MHVCSLERSLWVAWLATLADRSQRRVRPLNCRLRADAQAERGRHQGSHGRTVPALLWLQCAFAGALVPTPQSETRRTVALALHPRDALCASLG